MKWLETWLGRGISFSWTLKTGAEKDKCLECGVERQAHSRKAQGHVFKDKEA
jgi:hypothetical protein